MTAARTHAKVTLEDGQVYAVSVDQRDYVRYDMTYKTQGWPPGQEAIFILQTFTAAAALIREGTVPDTDPVKLMGRIVLVDVEEETPVRPTVPEPGSG